MGGDSSSKWSQITDDYNLIHSSHLAARLFGFGGRVAHGMHVVGLSLSTLQDATPPPDSSLQVKGKTELQVSFRKPVLIEGETILTVQRVDCGSTGASLSKDSSECIQFQVSSPPRLRAQQPPPRYIKRAST